MDISAKMDTKALDKFIKEFKKPYIVKIGILGMKKSNARNDAGSTNAEIGVKHEFGSFSDNIPQRSFLRMPIFAKTGDILAKTKQVSQKLVEKGAFKGLFDTIGANCVSAIQEAFATAGFGLWKPNAKMTIELKKSSSPLIDTSQLRRSIEFVTEVGK